MLRIILLACGLACGESWQSARPSSQPCARPPRTSAPTTHADLLPAFFRGDADSLAAAGGLRPICAPPIRRDDLVLRVWRGAFRSSRPVEGYALERRAGVWTLTHLRWCAAYSDPSCVAGAPVALARTVGEALWRGFTAERPALRAEAAASEIVGDGSLDVIEWREGTRFDATTFARGYLSGNNPRFWTLWEALRRTTSPTRPGR